MRFLSIATFALAVAAALAFSPLSVRPYTSSTRLTMSTTVEEGIPIVVTGNNIELTEALQDYVKQKLDRPLEKIATSELAKGVSCEVYLVVNKNPKVSGVAPWSITLCRYQDFV
jgi:hypothetical protein